MPSKVGKKKKEDKWTIQPACKLAHRYFHLLLPSNAYDYGDEDDDEISIINLHNELNTWYIHSPSPPPPHSELILDI